MLIFRGSLTCVISEPKILWQYCHSEFICSCDRHVFITNWRKLEHNIGVAYNGAVFIISFVKIKVLILFRLRKANRVEETPD